MRILLRLGAALVLLWCGPLGADVPGLRPLPPDRWNTAAARHLLERAGFGGTPEEVRRLARMSLEEAVSSLVDYEARPMGPVLELDLSWFDPRNEAIEERIKARLPQRLEAQRAALKGRTPTPAEAKRMRRQAEIEAVDGVNAQLQRENWLRLRAWWLTRMAFGRRPLEEKMTLFWHGHFTSARDIVKNLRMMAAQNALFRKHATGSFARLLDGVARDPAMISYLDGNRNIVDAPNENFARELLELFTMGVGNYTEADVRAAARAFTGWMLKGEVFFYHRYQHDYGQKAFMGRTGRLGGEDILETILEQHATARHLVTRLCRFFMGSVPGPDVVAALAGTLRSSRYQLKPVLRQLFSARAFYEPKLVGRLVKSPTELAVGLVKQTGLPAEAFELIVPRMVAMGQTLFNPPSVKGWDGGRAWISSATLLARQSLIGDIIKAGQARARRRREADALYSGYSWSASEMMKLPIVRDCEDSRSPGDVVDRLAGRLYGGRLTFAQRARLVRQLKVPGQAFDPRGSKTRARILSVVLLMTATPEFQLH